MARERARINAFHADDPVVVEIGDEALRGAVVGMGAAEFLDHEPFHMDAGGFDILAVNTVVADQRVCHDDDLPGVGGVRQDFLVTRKGRIENDLPRGLAMRVQ